MQSRDDFLAKVKPPITPALVVRRAVMMDNLAAMQAACAKHGVRLRAHGKMHKCSAMGLEQVRQGAVGLCCQTVGEAEAFVHGGIPDVLVTAPVPPWGWLRLAALARVARVGAVIDSEAQAAEAATAALAAGVVLDAYVDVDPGMARAGVAPGAAAALAALIDGSKGLNYAGIQAYCGHHQHMLPDSRAGAHAEWTARLRVLVAELEAAGLAPAQVTGGGTGTAYMDLAAGVYTELQPGSYAVMDVEYGDLGDLPFAPALFLAAAVARQETHVDAGNAAGQDRIRWFAPRRLHADPARILQPVDGIEARAADDADLPAQRLARRPSMAQRSSRPSSSAMKNASCNATVGSTWPGCSQTRSPSPNPPGGTIAPCSSPIGR